MERYEIEQEIGRGGMGVVYRARDTRLGRAVALKMLPPEMASDPELRQRMEKEARAASALSHPGIATLYDYVDNGAECFLVFELVEGETLGDSLARRRFTPPEALQLAIQLADALAAAHERGVVHRDLKPANIMLTTAPRGPGRVKILDFGLARLTPAPFSPGAATRSDLTRAGQILGTVHYMAPEQALGQTADHRSDLFALGLVIYEMVSGKNPFGDANPASTMAAILKEEAPPLAGAPGELDRIVRKCLRKRAEERYQSARDLLVDLSNLAQDAASSGEPAPAAGLAEVEMPRWLVRLLLAAVQIGYLAIYAAVVSHPEAVEELAAWMGSAKVTLAPWGTAQALIGAIFMALVGTAVRLYLFFAVLADFADLGRKYKPLFPFVALLDFAWAAAPLLLLPKIGLAAILAVVALAYLAYAQRALVYTAYAAGGGRISTWKGKHT
jgi:hypothetical protein